MSDVFKLSDTMEVRFVPIDSVRERDVNARQMDAGKFDILMSNIKQEGMLESLPLVRLREDLADSDYEIISGHHRIRAARKVGMTEVPVIVITREMTEDEVISKQLSHNSLNGHDDEETLKRLYDSIQNFDWKVASGVTDIELGIEGVSVPLVDIDINFDFEPVLVMFIKPELDKFNELIDSCKAEAEHRYMANMTEFRKFSKVVNAVSQYKDIRNIAGIVSVICDLAKERLTQLKEEDEREERK